MHEQIAAQCGILFFRLKQLLGSGTLYMYIDDANAHVNYKWIVLRQQYTIKLEISNISNVQPEWIARQFRSTLDKDISNANQRATRQDRQRE